MLHEKSRIKLQRTSFFHQSYKGLPPFHLRHVRQHLITSDRLDRPDILIMSLWMIELHIYRDKETRNKYTNSSYDILFYATISHHFITSDSLVIPIASPTEAKDNYGLPHKHHSLFFREVNDDSSRSFVILNTILCSLNIPWRMNRSSGVKFSHEFKYKF